MVVPATCLSGILFLRGGEMSESKKFYWLKLKNDFFQSKEIKKLRMIAGGDTYTIIYLKMQLLSINNGGIIIYERTEEDIAEQLAIEMDESIENVKITLSFLYQNNLVEQITDDEMLLNKVPEVIGSETSAAERMRKFRERKQLSLLNDGSRNNVTPALRNRYTEKETEIEIEIDKEQEKEKEQAELFFNEFWSIYPIKKDKVKCKAKYVKLIKKKGLHETIITALKEQLEHRKILEEINNRRSPRNQIFIPSFKHPKTWLNNECWNDEIEEVDEIESDYFTDIDINIEKFSRGMVNRFGQKAELTDEEKAITRRAIVNNAKSIGAEYFTDEIFLKTLIMRLEDINNESEIKEIKRFYFKGAFGEDKYLWRLTKTEENHGSGYHKQMIEKAISKHGLGAGLKTM